MTLPGQQLTAPRAQQPPAFRRYRRPALRRPAITISRLLLFLVAFLPIIGVLLTDSPVPVETRLVGWVLWVMCFYPTWEYMNGEGGARRPIPFLPLIGFLFAWYYARPLVFGGYNEHWRIRLDPTTNYNFAAQVALEGWVMLLLGWKIALARFGTRGLRPVTFDQRRVRRAARILAGLAPLAQFAQTQIEMPIVLGGFARLSHSLGYLGIGLLVMLVTERRASFGEKAWLVIVATTMIGLQIGTGFVSGAVITAAVMLLSFWAVRRRLSLPLAATGLLVVILTLTIKGTTDDFRKTAWRTTSTLTTGEKVSLMASLASSRIATTGFGGTLAAGWRSSVKRSANMDLFSDIVKRTPSRIDYWYGRSYISLVGLAVPRFLWPDKPTKNLGQEFGHRYSLLDAHDTHTSFNLPWLVEFYANFGEAGVILGMLVIGVIYGILNRMFNKPLQAPLITIAGLVLMLPLLNIESDFSLTFGGLLMDGAALWIILRKIQGSPLTPRG